MKIPKKLTIVTRKSALALWQANFVRQQLQNLYPTLEIDLLGVTTKGDEILDQPLTKIGGKGLFTKELEQVLLKGEAQLAVHSMKDVPSLLPDGLMIAAILERADPRDVLLATEATSLKSLPKNATVGTSSLRREAQIKLLRSDLNIVPLRGNVDTRLQKLLHQEFDAIILAAAGLQRLGLEKHITAYFEENELLPGIGQGALGLECGVEDKQTQALIQPLHHRLSGFCIEAERSMNTLLGGSCLLPVAGLAQIQKGKLSLRGLVSDPKETHAVRAKSMGKIEKAKDIGKMVAEMLLKMGAKTIIDKLT